MRDMLLVLDFSRQYAAAAAIKLRGERIFCRILPGDTDLETVITLEPMGLVLAGGVEGEPPAEFDGRLLRAGIPVLALGDAAVSAAMLLSGETGEALGLHSVQTTRFMASPVTGGLTESERMLETVRPLTLPRDLLPLAVAEETTIGFMHATLPIFGFEFQIEANDPDGTGILLHFAREVCGCTPWWSENAFISAAKSEISEAAGEGNAVCVMTGGLDSGVTAMLAQQAVGERLRCIFVDNGLLREDEADAFMRHYRDKLSLSIVRVNARDQFLKALKGKTKAADKRRAVSETMQRVLDQTASTLSFDAVIRARSYRGPLSGDVTAPCIHTDKPVVEPLRELFRDEIRNVGVTLGMPPEVTSAQPFPATGLALRIVGEVTESRLSVLRGADAAFRDEISQAGLSKRLWKYFAFLYHIPYENEGHPVAVGLRALGAASAAGTNRTIPSRLPYDLLERYVERVRRAYPEVRKIFYDVTPGESLSEDERF